MITVKQWLAAELRRAGENEAADGLDDVFDAAINDPAEMHKDEKTIGGFGLLSGAFIWQNSKQEYLYWQDLDGKLSDFELLPPEVACKNDAEC